MGHGNTASDTSAFPALAPHLICAGAAEAIEFYTKVFGAEEMQRLPGPDGKLMHAAVRIKGAVVMLADENPAYGMLGPIALGGTAVTIHLMDPDVDATVARAVAAGAEVTMEVADQFWGDRYGQIRDPFGHSWSIATPLRDEPLTDAELREAAKGAMNFA